MAKQAAEDGIDSVNPRDFEGEVASNNEQPSAALLRKLENVVVLDQHGKSHTFKSIYTGPNVARRVLIIFVRHFYCGNCQDYIRSVSSSITPDALLRLPISTFIAIVGCGDPGLIELYARETNCPFPIYTDPTRKLYTELGMVKTLALGERPAYMRKSIFVSSLASIAMGLKQLGSGLALKGGDQRQIGGEFLFEPMSVMTPIEEIDRQMQSKATTFSSTSSGGGGDGGLMGTNGVDGADESLVEEKQVTWCHRMKSTRDHAEVPELMEVLGLDGQGQPGRTNSKRWSRALEQRKGAGSSMAAQMSEMKAKAAGT